MGANPSIIRRNEIEYPMVLIFDADGGVRLTRAEGKLKPNERTMHLAVTLPRSIFKRPTLKAEVKVDPIDISIPPVKVDAIQDALRDAFGADVLLTIQTQEQPQ